MWNKPIFIAFLGLFGVLFMMVLGCSSGTSAVVPDYSAMSDIPEARENAGGCMPWGLWNVAIDSASGAVDITDIRSADDCLNVLGFLEPPALANMGISNLIISAPTRVQVDVSLTHPFTTSSHVFHGFDVKGVVFGANLVNRDGTTAWMNPTDFSGVPFGYQDGLLGVPHSSGHYTGANWGYKYFADGLTKNQDLVAFFSNITNMNKRGIFTEGSANTRHYDMTFTPSSHFLVFNYAVVANYDWPTGSPPYNANSFPIATANCREAFCITAYEVSNNLWYDTNAAVGGGTLDIDVEVYDWQGLGNTTVSLTGGGLTPVNVSTWSPGSTTHSGIFSFTGLAPTVGSSAPKMITVTATDSSATFGSSWFMGMLPSSNSKYNVSVYSSIVAQFNVATAGNYYTNTSVSDFVLYNYPHQAQGCKWDFVDYYNFTAPPVFGRHDICVHSGPGSVIGPSVQVLDTAGASPFRASASGRRDGSAYTDPAWLRRGRSRLPARRPDAALPDPPMASHAVRRRVDV